VKIDKFDFITWILGFVPRSWLYWFNVAGKIRFGDAVQKARRQGCDVFVGSSYEEWYLQFGCLIREDGREVKP
jgi:hypothetical protein